MNYPDSFMIHDKLAVRRIYREEDGTNVRYEIFIVNDELWISVGDFLLEKDGVNFDNPESEENLKEIKEHIEAIVLNMVKSHE